MDQSLNPIGENPDAPLAAADEPIEPDTGVEQIDVIETVAMIELEPNWLWFDYLAPGESDLQVVTVKSIGDAPLTVSSVEWTSDSSGRYTVLLPESNELPVLLEPGESMALSVVYEALESEAQFANLRVYSDDPAAPSMPVEVGSDGCESVTWSERFFVQSSASDPNRLDLYQSFGDGTFDLPITIGDDMGEAYSAPVVGDFDGDGSLEVLARGRDSGSHYWIGYDACEQEWQTRLLADDIPYNARGGGDLDGDGNLDLFGWDGDLVGYTSLGNGDGTFTHLRGAFDPLTIYSQYSMNAVYHAEDINGDGNPDLVLLEYSSGGNSPAGLFLFAGLGDGTFGASEWITDLSQPANGADLADIDGDGHADLVVGLDDDGDPGQTWVLHGTGTGLGSPIAGLDVDTAQETGSDQCCVGSLRLNDWDLDGTPDLLAGFYVDAWTTPQVVLYLNNGNGAFATVEVVLEPGEAPSIAVYPPL
jgi:hypothetical protein